MGYLIKDIILINIVKFVKYLCKKTFSFIRFLFKNLINKFKIVFKNYISGRNYRNTIRRIVNKEISVPPYFLNGKSPEHNPESKLIFHMIENGEIEEPEELKIAKFLQNNPVDLKDIIKQVDISPKYYVPEINKYFKKNNNNS